MASEDAVADMDLLGLEHRYAQLPSVLHAPSTAAALPSAELLRINRPLARRLGLDVDRLSDPDGVAALGGQRALPGTVAMAYAGHQFGRFVPRLGDGRALLLGERVGVDGARYDVHLKGSGVTPFSRGGDGRAGLGPVLREYVVSEGMAGLGIPTTRSLAILGTGERVARPMGVEPGAILVRIASSHVRVGTFEYLAYQGDHESLRALADHVIAIWARDAAGASHPYRALLDAIVRAQAELIADWMLVGFVHGVMNTDNMSVTGETIDYGPCAFLDTYHPATVYSSIDRGGRYAYDQQPRIGHWNLACLAQCLLPLLAPSEDEAIAMARDALDAYGPRYERRFREGLLRKVGLVEARDGDLELALDLLQCMADQQADFTETFRALCDAASGEAAGHASAREQFRDPGSFDAWVSGWRARLSAEARDAGARREDMRSVNPAYIPRNHRIQQVIEAATQRGDLGPLEELLAVVTDPYADHPERAAYRRPPAPHEVVRETFCGT